MMHDCLPPGFYMTARDIRDPRMQQSRFGDWWTGDVWQVVPMLQEFRPDLSITLIDAVPTGLVIVSNLDPTNNALSYAYDEITSKRFPRLSTRAAYDAYWERVGVEESETYLLELIETDDVFGRDAPRSEAEGEVVALGQRNAPCPCGSGKKLKHCHGRLG